MLRILSDLHFHDAASRVQCPSELEPLFAGVDTLWLNGDTSDNQEDLPPRALDELRAYFRSRVPEVRFLTGNHDPDISADHWLTAAEGRLFATHGDVFFDDIAPWGRRRDELVARLRTAAAAHPALDKRRLDDRLQLHRLASLGLPPEYDPKRADLPHRLQRVLRALFPPRQAWAMLRSWYRLPDLVAARAPAWYPQAQLVVTGHVHFPRVWRRGALTIVNTGAFTGPLGAYLVDLSGETATVRRVARRAGRWHPGRIVATVRLRARPGIL